MGAKRTIPRLLVESTPWLWFLASRLSCLLFGFLSAPLPGSSEATCLQARCQDPCSPTTHPV